MGKYDANAFGADWGREAARQPEVKALRDVIVEAESVCYGDARKEPWPVVRLRIGALRDKLATLLEGEH